MTLGYSQMGDLLAIKENGPLTVPQIVRIRRLGFRNQGGDYVRIRTLVGHGLVTAVSEKPLVWDLTEYGLAAANKLEWTGPLKRDAKRI